MPKKLFEKGWAGGPGRPPGVQNRNCMMPVFWYNLIADCSAKMSEDKKIDIAFRALNLLMPKVLVIPATPNDSVNNATLMAAVEANARLRALPTAATPPLDAPRLDSTGSNGNGANGSRH